VTTKAAPLIVLAALGAFMVIASRRARAEPFPESPEVPITPIDHVPTRSEILSAEDFQTLDDYYIQISLLYRGYKISFDEYMDLYGAYEQRFYELWGAL